MFSAAFCTLHRGKAAPAGLCGGAQGEAQGRVRLRPNRGFYLRPDFPGSSCSCGRSSPMNGASSARSAYRREATLPRI
jgi:hypothetical protein